MRAVLFDVGETLVDESRIWEAWADWLGVPRPVLLAVQRDVIARGQHHLDTLRAFRPGFDLARERASRAAAGLPDQIEQEDLYPDVRPCLDALHRAGYRIGVAGNQPATGERLWRTLALPVDVISSSHTLGVEKPSPAFFRALAGLIGLPPERCAYVGDRVDNDILPAAEVGMTTVFIRRGPWGVIHATWPDVDEADARIDTLAELPHILSSAFERRALQAER